MTLSPPRAALPPADQAHRSATLLVGCAATLLVLMNYSAPATTLPQTAAGLGAGPTGQVWILNGIALGLAATLLTAGTLADDHGRKRVFLIGSAALAAASVVCAAAGGTLVFVLARIVQGGASAAMLSASLGMIAHAFPPGAPRVRATAAWGAMIGAGLTAGPPLSAVLAQWGSWRLVYWVLGGVAALLTLAGVLRLRESRAETPRRMDVPGVLALGLGLTALLTALTQGRAGWASVSVVALFAAAAVLLAAFVAIEARSRAPMLDLSLFRRPPFLASIGGALVTGLAVIGPLTYLATIVQVAHGFAPLEAAGMTAIWTSVSAVSSIVAGRTRLPGRAQLAAGLAVGAAGDLGLLGTASHWSWGRASAALVLIGIGSGLANAALARLSVESVPAGRAAMGSGANNTARYIGGSVGVAVAAAVVGAARTAAAGTDVMFVAAAVVAALGAVLALALRDRTAGG
ncbi:MFS transporter [Microbispora corallina]|uniref:MFS transporter n=1 Tax=Microbispora corallina TaxID=83302 RepID=UPI0031DD6CB4